MRDRWTNKLLLILIIFVGAIVFGPSPHSTDGAMPMPMRAVVPYTGNAQLEIAKGTFPGLSHVNKFGANSSIADGTVEEVWDGSISYTWPTTATITHIKEDTDQAADRGLTIEVEGLDSNWDLVVQTKSLDGADSSTLVALDTPLCRIFRMSVLDDVVASDDIQAMESTGVTSYAIMMAGNNQTLMAIYTVPNSKTAYITQYYGGSILAGPMGSPDSAEFKLWVADRDNGYEFQLKHVVALPQGAPMIMYGFRPYLKVTQKSDIRVTAAPDGDDIAVHAGFDLVLVDN